MDTLRWVEPPIALGWPAAEEVHLWRLPLLASAGDLFALQALLSEDERQRAIRYRFDRDRLRYTIARGMLRRILAAYLGRPPAELKFGYGERGKPFLQLTESGSGARGRSLEFNLSHSGELALFAVASGRAIGVDVEQERALEDWAAIAERFFAAGEQAAIARLPQKERQRAFFDCWARKEAYIKAVGDGLAIPLDGFEVSVETREARLLSTAWRSGDVER